MSRRSNVMTASLIGCPSPPLTVPSTEEVCAKATPVRKKKTPADTAKFFNRKSIIVPRLVFCTFRILQGRSAPSPLRILQAVARGGNRGVQNGGGLAMAVKDALDQIADIPAAVLKKYENRGSGAAEHATVKSRRPKSQQFGKSWNQRRTVG